ncbi:C-C motif chemokine 20b [Leuresthes tenuis]|uniref:C-C motif chemokine 20b n=1 Tax=Leuresthes tenuis TaxID=355514 RepID=UPI003B501358
MSTSKACVVVALCSLVILSSFISSTDSASCCMRYTRRPQPCKRLLGYSIQTITGSCDINAIIFHIPGRFVCADPSVKWTQRGMKCVDERRVAAQVLMKKASEASVTPALQQQTNA